MLWPAAGVQAGGDRGPNQPGLYGHVTVNNQITNDKMKMFMLLVFCSLLA